MRNWANREYKGTLEAAIIEMEAENQRNPYMSSRIGMVVQRDNEPERTLFPQHNAVGFAPGIGDEIECSGLGIGAKFIVKRVCVGFPGSIRIY